MRKKVLLILFAVVGAIIPARSQLCTGSLGDPVVYITFGGGSNPGPSLRAATTYYSFINADCPNDGSYTVRNQTANCFGNSWHALTEDHTPGDQGGYFMLVNASFIPGDFYLDTVRGLCTNTTYEFAAWVYNVLRTSACGGTGIDPNLTFTIETPTGAILSKYETGNIPDENSPTWKQYGLFFETPANTTSVVVRIRNNAPGGCGNDIALDDITFRPCGPKVNAAITITGDTTAQLCDGDATVLQLGSSFSTGYNSPVFQWQVNVNGAGWTDIPGATGTGYQRDPTPAGQFQYRLTMAEGTNAGLPNCRVASNQVNITIHPLPQILLNDNTKACEGITTTLLAAGGTVYDWTGPNGFTSNTPEATLPAIQFADAGLYHVTVTSDAGCSQVDSTRVEVNPAVAASVSNSTAICEGTGVTLQASGGIQYQWTPVNGLSSSAIANPFANPTDTTTYQVTVFNQFGCFDTASVTVNIWKRPIANAGPDKKTREGEPVILDGLVQGTNISYYWSPPAYLDNPNTLQPSANPEADFTYTLYVTSGMGCGVHTDDVFIRVYQKVKVPNAFSPNGDGTNDIWRIAKLNTYPEADIQVYNRYGQLVFKSRGYSTPWDGKYNGQPLPVGTYYYMIDLKTEVFPRLNGWVFIVR